MEMPMTRPARWLLTLVALSALSTVRAADVPQVQEGLWDVRVRTTEQPGNKQQEFKFQLCRSHAYDKQAQEQASNVPGCVINKTTAADGTITSDGRCTVDGTVIVSRGTTTIQPDATHSQAHATYTPALAGKTEEDDVQDQKYVGECPADMKPGDRIVDGTMHHTSR
jgi:hypothetical protein